MTETRPTFKVKNYEQFQHYKDRSPPWIKFYNSVLDDYAFTSLPDAARSHLVAIWLLASRTGNEIPYDPEWVRMAIKASSPVNLTQLVQSGFIIINQDCSIVLASCEQSDRPERETEERERERESFVADATDESSSFENVIQLPAQKEYALSGRVFNVLARDVPKLVARCPHRDVREVFDEADAYYSGAEKPPDKPWFTLLSWFAREGKKRAEERQQAQYGVDRW